MFSARWIRVYVLPGAVFQSVVMGGGYGTGREVIEYISKHGAIGGLASIGAAFLTFAVLMSLSYRLASVHRILEYRTFFKHLLGRWWFSYEVIYIFLLLLVIAVVAAASSEILEDTFGTRPAVGIGITMIMIGIMNFYGRTLVNRVLTVWAFLVMVVLIAFVTIVVNAMWTQITAQFGAGLEVSLRDSVGNGFLFAFYNSAAIPALLFAAAAIRTRREAYIAGTIAALLAVLPAFLFHVSFMGYYPAVLEKSLPTYWVVGQLGNQLLSYAYVFVLFGTIVQTGVGMLQGLNERIDAWCIEDHQKALGRGTHAVIACGVVATSATLSGAGVIALVAIGYSMLAWSLLIVFVVPLLFRSFRSRSSG